MRNVIKGNKSVINAIKYGPGDSEGYWQARGFATPSSDTLMQVPYHDFHENGSKVGSKKNLLTVKNSCVTAVDEMENSYAGVLLTQGKAIPNGFFMYSCALMHNYFTMCKLAKMLHCEPEKQVIIDKINSLGLSEEQSWELMSTVYKSSVALEICTRTFYEGSGALGGYKDKVWLLWGRLSGIGCPTNQKMLSDEQAISDCISYYEGSYEARLVMFSTWFMEAYSGEFEEAKLMKDLGVELVHMSISVLFECWEWIKCYKAYEIGKEGFDFSDPEMDLEEATFYVKALSAGNFRRLSKGITEGSFSDYTDAQHLSRAMSDPVFEAILENLLSGPNGLCNFGAWLINANDVAAYRIDLYFEEEVDEYGEKKKATKFKNVD
jgi:hypothetical protein